MPGLIKLQIKGMLYKTEEGNRAGETAAEGNLSISRQEVFKHRVDNLK